MTQASPCAADRPSMLGVSSSLLHICMALSKLAAQPVRAALIHAGAASKPAAIDVFEPGSVAAYIADGEPYGDPLPDVYSADGFDVYGLESIVPTVRGSRKLLHGCHASRRRCATSSLCSNLRLKLAAQRRAASAQGNSTYKSTLLNLITPRTPQPSTVKRSVGTRTGLRAMCSSELYLPSQLISTPLQVCTKPLGKEYAMYDVRVFCMSDMHAADLSAGSSVQVYPRRLSALPVPRLLPIGPLRQHAEGFQLSATQRWQ